MSKTFDFQNPVKPLNNEQRKMLLKIVERRVLEVKGILSSRHSDETDKITKRLLNLPDIKKMSRRLLAIEDEKEKIKETLKARGFYADYENRVDISSDDSHHQFEPVNKEYDAKTKALEKIQYGLETDIVGFGGSYEAILKAIDEKMADLIK